METDYVGDLFLYNLFTYGAVEIISPSGDIPPPVFFNDSGQTGYTSEVAAWLALSSDEGSLIGTNDTGSGVVYIDPSLWTEPQSSRIVQCKPPCTLVLPPISLSTETTIRFPPWTTELTVGWTTSAQETVTVSGTTATITAPTWTSVVVTTTLTIPPLTTNMISI